MGPVNFEKHKGHLNPRGEGDPQTDSPTPSGFSLSLFFFYCSKIHIMEDLPSATLSPFTMFQNVLITPNRNPIPMKHRPPFSLLQAPGNHASVFCLYELAIPGHFIETESHNMWPFESGFCHLTPFFRDTSMLLCVSEHHLPARAE